MKETLLFVSFTVGTGVVTWPGDVVLPLAVSDDHPGQLSAKEVAYVRDTILAKAKEGGTPEAKSIVINWWEWLRPSPSPPAAEGKSEGEP